MIQTLKGISPGAFCRWQRQADKLSTDGAEGVQPPGESKGVPSREQHGRPS